MVFLKAYCLAIWEWLFGTGTIFAKLLQEHSWICHITRGFATRDMTNSLVLLQKLCKNCPHPEKLQSYLHWSFAVGEWFHFVNPDLLGSLHGRSPQMHWLSSLSFLWWLWNAFLSPEVRFYLRFRFQVGTSLNHLNHCTKLCMTFLKCFVLKKLFSKVIICEVV